MGLPVCTCLLAVDAPPPQRRRLSCSPCVYPAAPALQTRAKTPPGWVPSLGKCRSNRFSKDRCSQKPLRGPRWPAAAMAAVHSCAALEFRVRTLDHTLSPRNACEFACNPQLAVLKPSERSLTTAVPSQLPPHRTGLLTASMASENSKTVLVMPARAACFIATAAAAAATRCKQEEEPKGAKAC